MSELTQREKDLGWCEEAQTYCSVAEDRYKQGRADTIDELKPFIHKNPKGQKFIFVNAEDFKNLDLFEQLKSQN